MLTTFPTKTRETHKESQQKKGASGSPKFAPKPGRAPEAPPSAAQKRGLNPPKWLLACSEGMSWNHPELNPPPLVSFFQDSRLKNRSIPLFPSNPPQVPSVSLGVSGPKTGTTPKTAGAYEARVVRAGPVSPSRMSARSPRNWASGSRLSALGARLADRHGLNVNKPKMAVGQNQWDPILVGR